MDVSLILELTTIFLKIYLEKLYVFSLNLENSILFLKNFLENVKLYLGFPGKMNLLVCGNPISNLITKSLNQI